MPKIQKNLDGEINELLKEGAISLVDNDRPYSSEEEEAEVKAIRFSVTNFPRVPPIPGTLGFLSRNIRGGNEAIINFLKNVGVGDNTKFIKNFIILWNVMDEYSRKRVDIFDILCEKYNVRKGKFWGRVQEGMFDNHEALAKQTLLGYKAEFVELLKKMARMPKNHKDRELLAHALGLKKDSPLLQFTDNSVTQNTKVEVNQTNINLPSFAKSMRQQPSLEEEEPKQLSEGKQDYIDAEWQEVRRDLDDFAFIEQKLEKSAKELR